MRYEKALNNLRESINTNRKSKLFGESLSELKKLGFDISTKFLRELVINQDFRYRTYRIKYLRRANGLKTKRVYRFYSCWDMNKYKVDVTEWARNKDELVYSSECVLTDEEKAQIEEIKHISDTTGLNLYNRAEQNLKNRQQKRDSFNIGGKPFIKDIKSVEVGRFFRTNKKEVLFMVVVK